LEKELAQLGEEVSCSLVDVAVQTDEHDQHDALEESLAEQIKETNRLRHLHEQSELQLETMRRLLREALAIAGPRSGATSPDDQESPLDCRYEAVHAVTTPDADLDGIDAEHHNENLMSTPERGAVVEPAVELMFTPEHGAETSPLPAPQAGLEKNSPSTVSPAERGTEPMAENLSEPKPAPSLLADAELPARLLQPGPFTVPWTWRLPLRLHSPPPPQPSAARSRKAADRAPRFFGTDLTNNAAGGHKKGEKRGLPATQLASALKP
jgi:hypothetical protein